MSRPASDVTAANRPFDARAVALDARSSLRFAMVATIALCLAACIGPLASPPIAKPTGERPLAENEGWLIMHVDTAIALGSLETAGFELFGSLPSGRHVWLVRLPSGPYEWTWLLRRDVDGSSARLDLPKLRRAYRGLENLAVEEWKEQFTFEVRPGVVNYPGELVLEKAGPTAGVVTLRHMNHSAQAVRTLLDRYGALLAGHTLVYTGPGEDTFLEHYSRERDRLATRGRATPDR